MKLPVKVAPTLKWTRMLPGSVPEAAPQLVEQRARGGDVVQVGGVACLQAVRTWARGRASRFGAAAWPASPLGAAPASSPEQRHAEPAGCPPVQARCDLLLGCRDHPSTPITPAGPVKEWSGDQAKPRQRRTLKLRIHRLSLMREWQDVARSGGISLPAWPRARPASPPAWGS